jgi:7-cyano-7-deazaguanine synthase
MLSVVASLAQSLFPDDNVTICIGAHADDSAGNAYADCSTEFLKSMSDAIRIGTYNKVTLVAPFAEINKAEVVKTGLALKVPYELTWSCYNGGSAPCGKCGTCIDRARAFEANGVADPALKSEEV